MSVSCRSIRLRRVPDCIRRVVEGGQYHADQDTDEQRGALGGRAHRGLPAPDHTDPHAIYLASSHLSVEIRAGVAHATLHQAFANPNPWRAEGIYLFPLPEGATVTDFRLTMDGEPVRGEVLSAERARDIYLDIVRRIRDPALLEWMGHRIFQARIFPFEARGERELQLSWAQALPREGDYRVFRYLTGQGSAAGAAPLMIRDDRTVRIPDRPPVSGGGGIEPPRDRRSVFVVEGTIEEEYPIRSLYSPTHPLAVTHADENTRAAFSAEGTLYTREGFALYYDTGERAEIGLSLLTNRPPGDDGWFLLTITPGRVRAPATLPRDVFFVLDTSGSMQGDRKLDQAVAAIDFGLSTLGPDDRFALITYNSTVSGWRDGIAPAERHVVAEARDHIHQLRAEGGTNIEGALALSARLARRAVEEDLDRRPGPAGRRHRGLTYIVFLTDGLPTVGEEDPDALLELAGEDVPGEVRLFTWGVGYDVNAFLLDRLAGEHGGRSAYVEPHEDLEAKVSSFFSGVSTPVLSGLELSFPGADVFDLYPAELPDLFAGSEITVIGRFRGRGPAEIRLAGRAGERDETVRRRIVLPERERGGAFLAPMWAQRKVGFLLEQIRLHGESEELKGEIVALGERYGIVTPYTSYLVVEERMRRAMDELDLDAPEAMAAARMAQEAVMARSRPDRSVYSGRAGAREQTGAGDIQLSVAEQAMQNATIFKQADYLRVQRVEEKTFELQESGAWRDQALRSDQRLDEIAVGGEAFLALLARRPELARFAALGETVEVEFDGRGYRIVLPPVPEMP